jgi:hypothetical protein
MALLQTYRLAKTIVKKILEESAIKVIDFLKFKVLLVMLNKIDKNTKIINATGVKLNYCSINRSAKNIGYSPKYTSKSAILKEARILLTH